MTAQSQFHNHGPKNEIDELVLVVHGVGDPEPGETLSLFARSVAESQHPLTEHRQTLWLEDHADRPRDVKTFGTHVRHLEFCGRKSTLAEVFWGDCSRVNRGIIGVMSGLIEIVFGLRYVAFIASQQKGFAAKGLQWLGLIASRILHGPVLAVNYVLAILVLTVAGTESLWPGSSEVSRWANLLILGCVAVSLLSSYLGWRLTRNSVCHRFWYWVMVASGFLCGLMLFNQFTHLEFPLVAYCTVMVTMLGAQWMTLVVALLLMTVFWAIAITRRDAYRPALHVALILPAIAVGLWGQCLPLMWVTGSKSIMKMVPKRNEAQVSPILHDPHAGHNHVGDSGGGNTAAQSPIPTMTLVGANSSAKIRAQFKMMFDKAVPLIGVQCIMFLLLSLLLIVQLARYMRWSEVTTIEQFHSGRAPPRLIVNELVMAFIGTAAVVGMVLVMYVGIHEFLGHSHLENSICCYLIEANKYAIGFLVPVGGLLLLTMAYMRPALDIILDVVNHFYFRKATSADRVRGFNEDLDIDEVTFDGGEFYFSRRDVIHRRMKRILEYYRNTVTGNPTLTIVSHSQGSMVAIEVLNDDELDWIRTKFKKINFVTMGSPFTHIYQQYFRHFYPALDDPQWAPLRNRVDKWLNIYRIDDYVGTNIDFPETMPQTIRKQFTNHAVEPRGHMFYWRDRQVLSVIRQHDICVSLTPSKMSSSVPNFDHDHGQQGHRHDAA